ncbi:hypothetical protein EVG20_g5050 [Dentipellis fragilis]|uniref:Uncharacterized protein n=1 Tax=Dentipellis fragilis TaxID=205917 RepID=A0A4Y9YUC8_9AGAM|nr:hypothetical protein EVG20_g5050 [Dentipellis fragilis]
MQLAEGDSSATDGPEALMRKLTVLNAFIELRTQRAQGMEKGMNKGDPAQPLKTPHVANEGLKRFALVKKVFKLQRLHEAARLTAAAVRGARIRGTSMSSLTTTTLPRPLTCSACAARVAHQDAQELQQEADLISGASLAFYQHVHLPFLPPSTPPSQARPRPCKTPRSSGLHTPPAPPGTNANGLAMCGSDTLGVGRKRAAASECRLALADRVAGDKQAGRRGSIAPTG